MRPRLRFRPSPMAGESLTDWTGLFNLRSGSLRLQGLDLDRPGADERARRSAGRHHGLARDRADRDGLHDHRGRSTSDRDGDGRHAGDGRAGATSKAPAAPPATVIELRNAFVRSGGDAVTWRAEPSSCSSSRT